MPDRVAWEEALYSPGRVVYFPLKWTFKGTGELIGFIDDTKIIQQINDKLESDDGRRKLIFTYSSRTGGGAKYYQNGIAKPRLDRNIATITATAGLNAEQSFKATFEDYYLVNDLLSADFLIEYQKLTRESFYGFGMSSRLSDESSYSLEQTSIEAVLSHNLLKELEGNLLVGYTLSGTGRGYDNSLPSTKDDETVETLPGIESIASLVKVQIGLDYDSKNRQGNPSGGYEASLKAGLYQEVTDDKFGFYKLSVDARRYLHLFYNRVLVLRMAAEINEAILDQMIPFYYLGELGREETIRGYERGRFRENNMLLASLEYRFPIWHFWDEKGIDMILFTDTGQVSAEILNDNVLNNFRTCFGFGFRLWDWEDGTVAKLQVGWSDESYRIYFGLN
ncbi:MAG: BamA/TamA family outer membrane protein [Calditrichaeota bacterium]|nr:BamA/TamA family outer membrane protein [Calditrichota bacterium]